MIVYKSITSPNVIYGPSSGLTYVGLTSKQANNKLLPGHGSLGHCLHHADLLLLFVQLVFKKGKGFPVWVEGARGRELTSKCRLNCVGMETIAVFIILHSDALKLACHPVTQLDAMIQEMW